MKKLAFVLALMMVSGLSYAADEKKADEKAAAPAETKKEEKKADEKAAAPAEAKKEEKKADDKAAAPAEAKKEEKKADDKAEKKGEKVAVRTPTGDVDKFWDNLNWSDLSDEEKKIWAVLGWNEKNWSGDREKDAPASDKTEWDKLKKEEQEAATKLGYDKKAWDGE